jgi:FAD:protein FMN transferase
MRLFRHSFTAMGSPCELQIYLDDAASADTVTQRVVADVSRLEQRYSRYRNNSFLAAINRVAELGTAIEVDDETGALLSYADTCYRESEGLFDITSGLLRRAWRFAGNQLPAAHEIIALLDRVGWQHVRWQPPRLEFLRAGMELDFGGIVKEYAVDRAAVTCLDAGICSGYVNLGGDIRVLGPHPDGSPWRIGLRHPRQAGALIRSLELMQGAVASSGDYERCIERNGKRYGHILHPRTGWPVQHLAAVSVVGDLCLVAGSTSTIAMLKETHGPAWLRDVGLPHFWVSVIGVVGGSLA